MTRWSNPRVKKKRPTFEIIPVPYGSSVAHVLNGKIHKHKKGEDPYGRPFTLGVNEVKLPKGWYQTSVACPMQYSKIVRIGKDYYEGYLRSRHQSPFRIEIQLLYRDWRVREITWKKDEWWTHEPVDFEHNNPPIKSMRLINRKFASMVKEYENGKA